MVNGKDLKIAVDGFDGTGKTTLINSIIQNYVKYYSTSVERLIPDTVSLFKRFANNTNNYIYNMSNRFRVSAYLWESYLRLNYMKQNHVNDLVFFDRWIFSYLAKDIDFKEDKNIIDYLICSIPKPDILFLITMNENNIINHLKKKNDWMLSFYKYEEIITQINEFYIMYEKLLYKYNVNYIILDGNLPMEVSETIMKKEIDTQINILKKESV